MAIKELFQDNRPEILFDPRASRRIDPRFKFTRDSSGSRYDEFGILKVNGVPAGQPRFNYDPVTREYLGLLLESQSTNLLLRSEEFDNASWTKATATVTSNSAIAPSGTSTADKLVVSTGFTAGYFFQTIAFTSGVTYTVSCYAKAGEVADFRFVFQSPAFGSQKTAAFNLSTGQVSSSTAESALIETLPNGWYRCIATVTAIATVSDDIQFRAAYTGDGASGIYLWGAQLEAKPYPTSYIKTETASATRAADILTVNASIPATGTLFIDSEAIYAANGDVIGSLANASNQKLNLGYESRTATYNSLALVASYSGTAKTSLPLPVPTSSRERNIVTWGTQNYQYGQSFSRFAQSLASSVPANMNRLSIGSDAVDPAKAFNGHINRLYIWAGEMAPTVAEAMVRGELDPINADTYSPVGPTGSLALIINTQGASSSGDKVFALPAESALNDNDIVITWGDGTESGLDGAAAELGAPGLKHTYPSAGIYPVWVEGQLENLQFANSASAPDLVKIEKWGTTANGNDVFLSPSTMASAFHGCSKLTSMPSSGLPDTSAVTNWYRAFRGCSSLTGTFPSFNFSAATTFQEAFHDCSGLTSFTAAGDQTQNVTNFTNAWRDCGGLTSFPLINTSAGTTFDSAWRGCVSLTNFPLINTAAGTSFSAAWHGCSGLTNFPLINTAAGTNFAFAWYNCTSLAGFPLINTAAAVDLSFAWHGCSGLTSFPLIDTSSNTNFTHTWRICNSLTAFPLIDTAAGTSFRETWLGCSSLTAFPLIDTSSGANFSFTWQNCTGLTAFPALNFDAAIGLATDTDMFTGLRGAWQGCTSLTDFPAGRFSTTTCTRYLDAWTNCALTAQSIENILVSIEAAGTSNGNLGIGGGTNAAKTTWSTAANTAYDALVARGWTITYNA